MYARSHERYEEMGLSVGTMVLAVGLGGIGMKRGEVLVQLLNGHLAGVTFSKRKVPSENGGTLCYPSHRKSFGEGRRSSVGYYCRPEERLD